MIMTGGFDVIEWLDLCNYPILLNYDRQGDYNPLPVVKIVDKRPGSNHLHQIIFCRKGS